MIEQTQVGIIDAGPAGLLLSQVLHLHGINSVVVERRGPEYVLGRIRAGALEPGMVNFLRSAGVGERLDQECHPHKDIEICFENTRFPIDMEELMDGDRLTIYGQTDITKDLMAAWAEWAAGWTTKSGTRPSTVWIPTAPLSAITGAMRSTKSDVILSPDVMVFTE